uniref:Epstein-Barr virus induced 3 n=1 Tax=Ailuropoda melanoleuca TaxID=9646 RepID=A0A7N5K417_AILME
MAPRRSRRWGCLPRAVCVYGSVTWSVEPWPGWVPTAAVGRRKEGLAVGLLWERPRGLHFSLSRPPPLPPPTPRPWASRTPRPAATGEGTRAPPLPPLSSLLAPHTGQGVRPGEGEVGVLTGGCASPSSGTRVPCLPEVLPAPAPDSRARGLMASRLLLALTLWTGCSPCGGREAPAQPKVLCRASRYPIAVDCFWTQPTAPHSARPTSFIATYRLGVAAHGESRPCLQLTPEATSCTIPDVQMFSMVPYILNVTAVQPWGISSSFVPFVPEHIIKPDPPEGVCLSLLPGQRLWVQWEPPRSWPFPEIFSLKYWVRYKHHGSSRFRQVRRGRGVGVGSQGEGIACADVLRGLKRSPEMGLLAIHPKRQQMGARTNPWAPVFTAAPFAAAERQKPSKCLSTDE